MQDSAYDIALPVPVILKYAKRLLGKDYPSTSCDLKDSGYRRLNAGNFSLFANVGAIAPTYQPGHAHADELNFELYYKGIPLIVDTGVSTYEKNNKRLLERSTSSHNCVVVKGNSSDVWSGFRVGRRASVNISLDEDQYLTAEHDGYGTRVSRTFDSKVSGQMTIADMLIVQSNSNGVCAKGYLHLHPDVSLKQLDETTYLINNQIELTFQGGKYNPLVIEIGNYSYARGFNRLVNATVLAYSVFEQTMIRIREAC